MITALDTDGRCYLSLLQSTNDSESFILFLQEMTKKLEIEDSNWK